MEFVMTFFFCTQLCCRWSENALDVNATAKHVSNRNNYESSKFCKKKWIEVQWFRCIWSQMNQKLLSVPLLTIKMKKQRYQHQQSKSVFSGKANLSYWKLNGYLIINTELQYPKQTTVLYLYHYMHRITWAL